MLPLILLLFVSLASGASKNACSDETYYFHYAQNGSKIINYFESCSLSDVLSNCQNVAALTRKYHPTLGVRPFDEFAETYVRCFVEKKMTEGSVVDWIDLYGKHVELRNAKYYGHHLRALITEMEYETPKALNKNVDSLLVKTFSNSQSSEEVSGEISEEIAKTVETVTARQHDWNIGASVEMGASDVFGIAKVSVEASAEYSGSKAEEVTNTVTRTYTIADTVKVPPSTTVRVMWTMTEANVKIGWTSKMKISGMMAAQINGVIHFFPVGHMALVFEEYFKKISTHAISLEGKGNFYTTTSIQSEAHVSQFPLGSTPACFS